MAHPETEAVEVTDVGSAAQALSRMNEDFSAFDEQEETTEETTDEPADEVEQEPVEAEEDDESHDEQDEELEEAIQPPVSWSKEKKDLFAKLPPEAQEYIHVRESQLNKGFQEKTTELSEVKKAIEADKQRITQERQQYAQFLEAQIKMSSPQMPSKEFLDPNSPKYNPQEYMLGKADYDESVVHRGNLEQQRQMAIQRNEQEQKQNFANYVKEQDNILTEQLPEWSSPNTRQDITSFAMKSGYDENTLQNASAIDVITLHKAMKYDAMMSQKTKVQDKVKTVPKVIRGSTTGKSRHEATETKFNKLKKSGRTEDAAALLYDMI